MTGRIMVVDDIEQNVKLLEAKLSAEYYSVFSCYSGIECLQKVESVMPDLILLDVMMPDMDGFETCEKLKANPKLAHIPVVMVTALSEQSDRVRGLQSGATDFITKPIDEVHLLARTKSLVRIKTMLDELRMRDKTGEQFGLVSTLDLGEEAPKGNVLIIDDDIVQNNKAVSILEEAGHNVVSTTSPTEATQMALKQKFDLVIISSSLENIDSLRLGLEIKSEKENRHLPVMLLIEEEERDVLGKALEIGIDDYLMCPIDSNELVARTYTQIRRKHYQDALAANYEESISASVIDSLTKLYNRRYLDAHLGNIIDQAKEKNLPLTVMEIDIDHFKAVNDKPGWGHHIGDECLIEVANRITSGVRTTDLATRPGGEEFVVIMPNTTLELGLLVAERVRQMIAATPVNISAEPGYCECTVSIGVASLNENAKTTEDLSKLADEALYRAKNDGRNRVMTLQSVDMEAWNNLISNPLKFEDQ